MNMLTIDQAVPFAIPDEPLDIWLIGCGGTGSHIAQALARIAVSSSRPLALTFYDGDTVEQKNVGRQLFAPGDVGMNKAQVLAARFSALFGLDIAAIPRFFTGVNTPQNLIGGRSNYTLVIGAVDDAAGRRAIHTVAKTTRRMLWIDCGNHETAGQVCVGGTVDTLTGSFALGGLCTKLPTPSLLYPDLLKETEESTLQLACADAMAANRQSLLVNQMMAAIASEYVYKLVNHRQITTFVTEVDLVSLTMRSLAITEQNISTATGIPVADLRRAA